MFALHQRMAAERNLPLLPQGFVRDRATLGLKIALLRTIKPTPEPPKAKASPAKAKAALKIPKVKPETPIRDAIIDSLSVVTHYQDKKTGDIVSYEQLHLHDIKTLRTVGLPYAECLARIKAKVPTCQVKLAHLRGAVLLANKQAPGYQGVTFADTRPHGMKGTTR